jgi:hypothetical protein
MKRPVTLHSCLQLLELLRTNPDKLPTCVSHEPNRQAGLAPSLAVPAHPSPHKARELHLQHDSAHGARKNAAAQHSITWVGSTASIPQRFERNGFC